MNIQPVPIIPEDEFKSDVDYLTYLGNRKRDTWGLNDAWQYLKHLPDGLTRSAQAAHIIEKLVNDIDIHPNTPETSDRLKTVGLLFWQTRIKNVIDYQEYNKIGEVLGRIVAGSGDEARSLQSPNAEIHYKNGMDFLKKNLFELADYSFRQIAYNYSDSPLAGNANYQIARLSRQGIGPEPDRELHYYRKAAELGHKEALIKFMGLVELNQRNNRDIESTDTYLSELRKNASGLAMKNLGDYYLGKGDSAQAVLWYRRAIKGGTGIGSEAIAFLKSMATASEVELESASRSGDKFSKMGPKPALALGEMYAKGIGVSQNIDEANKFYLLATKLGVEKRDIGALEESAEGSEDLYVLANSDEEKIGKSSVENRVIEGDRGIGYDAMGVSYEQARGGELNISRAIDYYRQAAQEGNEHAIQRLVGLMGSTDAFGSQAANAMTTVLSKYKSDGDVRMVLDLSRKIISENKIDKIKDYLNVILDSLRNDGHEEATELLRLLVSRSEDL
jgi:TPR repeat protein